MNQLLKKIIRTGIGRSRFLMATFGMGVALLFILLAVQTHSNFNDLLYGKYNENESADFLVINKIINASNIGKKEETYFNEKDLADIKAQPFTKSLGILSATNFKINVQSYSEALPFYSDIYFESVPDEFVDLKSKEWKWVEGQRDLPVILPSFFLDLYNTGMSQSQQDLPQLSLDAIMAIPIKVTVQGNGITEEYAGHVVGQTDRLNSLLIPQSFMDYANKKYGYRQNQKPNRIVIKTSDPSDPALVQYLDKKGWKTNADKTRFSKVRGIVNWIVGIVGGVGIVMLLFGILVFSLFIQLTIASTKKEIELLQTLGTAPNQLQSFLMRLFMPANVVTILVSLLLIAALQFLLCNILKDKNMFISPFISWQTLGAAAAMLAMIWWVNRVTIRKYISI